MENKKYYLNYFCKEELKEWRSRKELEEYLLLDKRNAIIGWITIKTLKKWKIDINEELKGDIFIVQEGNKHFYFLNTCNNKYFCDYSKL